MADACVWAVLGAAVHTFLLHPDLFDKSADIIYYICIFRVGKCTDELEPKADFGTQIYIFKYTTVLIYVFDIRAHVNEL